MCLCLAEQAIADEIKCLDWSTVGLYWVEQPEKSHRHTHKDPPWPVQIVQTDFRGKRMAPRHTIQCVPPQSRSAVCLCVHNVLDGETGEAELKNIHDWLRPSSNQRYLRRRWLGVENLFLVCAEHTSNRIELKPVSRVVTNDRCTAQCLTESFIKHHLHECSNSHSIHTHAHEFCWFCIRRTCRMRDNCPEYCKKKNCVSST